MCANLFFLKYYIAYASVLLSKFPNHPFVFLVIAVSFTTIISVIRSIKAYNYLSVLRWLDTVFRSQYLSSVSINYVAKNKVLEKLPPQLY